MNPAAAGRRTTGAGRGTLQRACAAGSSVVAFMSPGGLRQGVRDGLSFTEPPGPSSLVGIRDQPRSSEGPTMKPAVLKPVGVHTSCSTLPPPPRGTSGAALPSPSIPLCSLHTREKRALTATKVPSANGIRTPRPGRGWDRVGGATL